LQLRESKMSDLYLEALQNYLHGSEWRQSLGMFVSANCKYFHNISELDHQHHKLWTTYQEIAETILEMMLQNIGGSFTQLEQAIDILQDQPSTGPRGEIIKEVLAQLLSFADFMSFASMMKAACDEQASSMSDGSNAMQNVDALLRMGFPIATIETVLHEQGSNESTLEELVMLVSGAAEQGKKPKSKPQTRTSSSSSSGVGGGAKYVYNTHDESDDEEFYVRRRAGESAASKYTDDDKDNSEENRPFGHHRSGSGDRDDPENAQTAPLLKFVREAAAAGVQVEADDLVAKFVVAESMIDSLQHGSAAAAGQFLASEQVDVLLRWAEDMQLLLHDIEVAHAQDLPCAEMRFSCPGGLIKWYEQLEQTRAEADSSTAVGSMVSDAELHRMAELNKIAAMGTADEQLLHRLIARHDELAQEVSAQHRQMSLLVASERGALKREHLEEFYLYLKQQVATCATLDTLTDDLYDHVSSFISSSKGTNVVNILLDMHILEDEQSMVRQQIQELVGHSPTRQGAEQAGNDVFLDQQDVSLQVEYDAKGHTLDDASDAKGTQKYGIAAAFGRQQSATSAAMFAADSKHGPSVGSIAAGVAPASTGSPRRFDGSRDDADPRSPYADNKAAAASSYNNPFSPGPTNATTTTPAAAAAEDRAQQDAAYLAEAKEKHRASLRLLKELLDADRSKQLSALEEKLMRRRALFKAQQRKAYLMRRNQAQDGDGGGMDAKGEGAESEQRDEEAAALQQEQALAVEEVEAEIAALQEKYDAMAVSMASGMKKRCMTELQFRRKKHEAMLQRVREEEGEEGGEGGHKASSSSSASPGGRLVGPVRLTDEELRAAHAAAAAEIKARFERDHRALLESLDRERGNQRAAILKRLAQRKHAAEGDEQQQMQKAEAEALAAMNLEFDEQQAAALGQLQTRTLLALSAVQVDEEVLRRSGAKEGEGEVDGEDGEAEGEGEGAEGAGRRWLRRVGQLQGMYSSAAEELQLRLRASSVAATSHSGGGGSGGIGGSGVREEEEVERQEAEAQSAALLGHVVLEAFSQHLADAERPFSSTASSRSGKGRSGGKVDTSSGDYKRLRAGIVEEFERTRRAMEDGLQAAQGRSKHNLALRRGQRRGHGQRQEEEEAAGAKGERDDRGDDDAGEATGAAAMSSEGLAAVEHLLEGFVEGSQVPSLAAAYKAASRAAAMQQQQRGERDAVTGEYTDRERDRIKAAHKAKEQSLVRFLAFECCMGV
jgi:hypothetical protein